MAECAQFLIAKCRPAARCFPLVLLFIAAGTPTIAAEIVALGASETEGSGQGRHQSGVSREQAYPAQLEAMLRAQNCAVSVDNSGARGDTTSSMLARLPGLLASDTKVLILASSPLNDSRNHRNDTKQNMAAIKALAAQHGVKVISYGDAKRQALQSIGGGAHCADAICHLDAEANAAIARYLLPLVKKAGVCQR